MLNHYEKEIKDLNKKMSLIGSSTEKNIWIRHFCDSAKIFKTIEKLYSTSKERMSVCDVGTGAGLPA